MLHAYRFGTVDQMHSGLLRRLATGDAETLDVATSVDTQLHNVMCHAKSFQFDMDLKSMWLGEFRWNMLIRQYIDPVALENFLNAIQARMPRRTSRGVATLRTNMVAVHQNASREWRKWGSCMLAVTFRRNPTPQITLHSRTSYIGYIAALDIRVAQHIGELIGERLGIEVEDMSFVWVVDMAQYHGFKSMAATLMDPEHRELIENWDPNDRSKPGVRITKKWLLSMQKEDAEGKLYGDMKFGQVRRIRKRMHSELLGIDPETNPYAGGDHSVGSQRKAFQPLPSRMLSTLDFGKLARPRMDLVSDLVAYAEEDEEALDMAAVMAGEG